MLFMKVSPIRDKIDFCYKGRNVSLILGFSLFYNIISKANFLPTIFSESIRTYLLTEWLGKGNTNGQMARSSNFSINFMRIGLILC